MLDSINIKKLDATKQLEFQKTLILIRKDIDGKDRVGIQAIKSYLDYLHLQEQQLLKEKSISSDDHIFYHNISDKCADVDIIQQATIMSKIFYYLNEGNFKYLSHHLEFDLLIRKIICSESQDKFELNCLKERLKDVLDKLVQYTNRYSSNSDDQIIETLSKQYAYHMIKSQEYMKERGFQEAIDELVVAQTQLNDLWSKLNNKDGFRDSYQRLIIRKLIITGQAKYFLKQDDGFKILLDALNMYADEIGMDEEYYEWYKLDQKVCLILLEGLDKHELNLQRLELEQIRLSIMLQQYQLKISDVDAMVDLYTKLENDNYAVDYEYYIFFYNMKRQLYDFNSAHKHLELILKNLQLQSHIQESYDIIRITLAISYQQLIQSPNAQQIYDISMQMLEKSCFRLKDNFNSLKFEDQINTINTERAIIIIQSEIDRLSIMKNQQQDASYQETYNRLQYLDDQFQANYQFKLPILKF